MLLEFWATWCGPCVQNVPHLNQLAEQFEARGLQFLSITPEEASTVQRFLQTHTLRGIVALDPGQAMLKLYGAGTPTTVLIDRSGRVVRKVHPSQITAAVLEDLVSDRPVQLSAIRDDMYPPQGGGPFGENESDASTIVKLTVLPSTKRGGFSSGYNPAKDSTAERVKTEGETLPSLLAFAYDLRPQQLVVSKYFQGGYYAVDAWVPDGQGPLLKPLVRNALEAAIGYQTHINKKQFDILVLEGLPGKLQAAQGVSIQNEKGLISADGWPLSQLANDLEQALKRPVLIDHIPSGHFQWHLQWKADEPQDLEKALSEQLGLRLRPERRLLPVLIVDTADSGESNR
jgi:uncharacterized protein (TIGR03435 family)